MSGDGGLQVLGFRGLGFRAFLMVLGFGVFMVLGFGVFMVLGFWGFGVFQVLGLWGLGGGFRALLWVEVRHGTPPLSAEGSCKVWGSTGCLRTPKNAKHGSLYYPCKEDFLCFFGGS